MGEEGKEGRLLWDGWSGGPEERNQGLVQRQWRRRREATRSACRARRAGGCGRQSRSRRSLYFVPEIPPPSQCRLADAKKCNEPTNRRRMGLSCEVRV